MISHLASLSPALLFPAFLPLACAPFDEHVYSHDRLRPEFYTARLALDNLLSCPPPTPAKQGQEAPLMCNTRMPPRMLLISLAVSFLLSVAGFGMCTAEDAQ